jgi:hypothetical protein
MSWKGTIYVLRDRISAVLNNKKLTARDIRRAKRDAKRFENGEITKEALLENFPGKTLDQILS